VLTTIPAADANFLTGAVLSWAIPITTVLAVLSWWGIVLTIRAFRGRR
jgi:hypothetical protein